MPPFFQAIVGDMVSMVAMVAILAGIIKLFQMASTMNEIKDLLSDIRRNTQDYPQAASNAASNSPRAVAPSYRPIDTTSEADAIIRASVLEPER